MFADAGPRAARGRTPVRACAPPHSLGPCRRAAQRAPRSDPAAAPAATAAPSSAAAAAAGATGSRKLSPPPSRTRSSTSLNPTTAAVSPPCAWSARSARASAPRRARHPRATTRVDRARARAGDSLRPEPSERSAATCSDDRARTSTARSCVAPSASASAEPAPEHDGLPAGVDPRVRADERRGGGGGANAPHGRRRRRRGSGGRKRRFPHSWRRRCVTARHRRCAVVVVGVPARLAALPRPARARSALPRLSSDAPGVRGPPTTPTAMVSGAGVPPLPRPHARASSFSRAYGISPATASASVACCEAARARAIGARKPPSSSPARRSPPRSDRTRSSAPW